jgi:hypothetical protein
MDKEPDLTKRVDEWLAEEGYSLEFAVAHECRSAGFVARQGQYVRERDESAPLGIDVLADSTTFLDEVRFLRLRHLIECTGTRDEPWVVFSSECDSMAESATAAQPIGCELGRSLLWCRAGDPALSKLSCFSSSEAPGFEIGRAHV